MLKAPVGLSKSKQELLTNTGSNVLAQNRIIVEKKFGTKARHSFWLAIAFVFAIVFGYFCNSPATHVIGHSLEGRFDVVSLRLLFPWLQVLQHVRLPLMTPVTISMVTISMVAGSAARAAAPDEPQVPGRDGGCGPAGEERRLVSRPGGRGQELPAAAAGAPPDARPAHQATQTHPLRRGAVRRYSITYVLLYDVLSCLSERLVDEGGIVALSFVVRYSEISFIPGFPLFWTDKIP